MIQLEDVSVERNGRQILKDINIEVRTGETLGIIGPTGAGKTTLLRVMDLIEVPSKGRVLFRGEAPKNESEKLAARRRIGVVFQRPLMLRGTVYDNVAYGLRIRRLSKDEIDKRVKAALSDVGLEGYERRPARMLSGGEMQRVALARALAISPEILLLDEPTANLDPRTSYVIEDLISSAKMRGMTVVISTHDLPQAVRLADRIVIIMDGRVVSSGSPDLLMGSDSDEVREFLHAGMLRHLDRRFIHELTRISH
ncbi:MAG: phosphate ABC transporter ATP-binding protein [Methanothrix sp.]|uniref:energy-coupling factor ABC transporter ATP-binding protein n=1 Tax=Methanothrix sp. TaxID=90426 RepID=UPI0025EC2A2D|nr:phosphate ABC transporter ATP-binding protein [Methanothrix sp.]MCQ8902798.1 phosphate ABC transporter ATP-binding protein [Methanothrix sp.]